MAEQETSLSARAAGPELRLLDRRAFIGFPPMTLSPGVVLTDFALQIPDVTFPLNLSGGAARYQKKRLDFGFLEVTVEAEVVLREVQRVLKFAPEMAEAKIHFRAGGLEIQTRLTGPERAPATMKVAFDGDGELLAVYFYDLRLYAFTPTPAARLGAILAQAIQESAVLPDVERRGANGLTARILPALVEQAAVSRGYKVPKLDNARLAEAAVSPKGLRLRFTSGGLPPAGVPDEELLLALEGARAFADAEELLAQNKLAEAKQAYLRLGDAADAHPFAVERLLSLLVADIGAHEFALDVAASLQKRRERSATALWAEAVIRERRGDFAKASERYMALVQLSRKHHDEAAGFFAAEAAARAAREHAPHLAVKALHELLGIRPDHVPSLQALARASDQAQDRAGAIRAYRRLAALARDPLEAADAHVQLARLCALTEDDIAGARLHCEAALRLSPDNPAALEQLATLCFRSGEHLRAVKAADRLREVALVRHEVDRVGRANILAGQIWETGLKQPENALLRYKEAAALLPGEPEPLYLGGRVSLALSKIQEAVAQFQQAIELAGPSPSNPVTRDAAHQSHHALSNILKNKLGEPVRAREHLEAALALKPDDVIALDELLPYFRSAGKVTELAQACERAAHAAPTASRRGALLAEAGELLRGRLGQPEKAERLLLLALNADPNNRSALESLLAIAESKRDGAQLSQCLKSLSGVAKDAKERASFSRRLAVAARDLTFDLDTAVQAYRDVLAVEPEDLPVLGELTALERRRGDMPGLVWVLERRAAAAEKIGDKRLAAAALRELAQVLDTRLGRAGEALVALEKAGRLVPDPNALFELATLSLRLERAPSGRRALEDMLSLLPKHAAPDRIAEVRAKLGLACEMMGDKDEAVAHYAAALPLRRLDDELAVRLETLYAEMGMNQALTDLWASRAHALTAAGRAIDAAPLYLRSAQRMLETGDTALILTRLNSALEAAPQGAQAAEVLELMASVELKRHEKSEAAKLYARRATLSGTPRESARWLYKASQLVIDTNRELGFLEQSLDKDSQFPPARLRRGLLHERSKPSEALADFEAVLEADPSDVDVVTLSLDNEQLMRRAAFAASRAHSDEAARRWFAAYVALAPSDTEALAQLAELYRRAQADAPLLDVLRLMWPKQSGLQRVQSLRDLSGLALKLERTGEALDALRSLVSEQPDDVWAARSLLGLLPVDGSTSVERLSVLTALSTHTAGEDKAQWLERRAALHRSLGELEQARNDLMEAAAFASRPAMLFRQAATWAAADGEVKVELDALSRMAEPAADDEGLLSEIKTRVLSLASMLASAADANTAVTALELAVRLPLSGAEACDTWLKLGQVAQRQGSTAKAERAFREAAKQGPAQKRVEALLFCAAAAEARGARDVAIDDFEGVLALAPRMPQAFEGLCRNLRAAGDEEGLAEVLSSEVLQTPKSKVAPLLEELTRLYLSLGQSGPAEATLRRLSSVQPDNAWSHQQLASLLSARGATAEAAESLANAAASLPVDEAAQSLRSAALLADSSGDQALALKWRRHAHRLAPAAGSDLALLANSLYQLGATQEVLPLQRQVALSLSYAQEPEAFIEAQLRLADVCEALGDWQGSEAALRKAFEQQHWSPLLAERLGALVSRRDARAGFEIVARFAEGQVPSPRLASVWWSLSLRAERDLSDFGLAFELGARAADCSGDPLPVRRAMVERLRNHGDQAALRQELGKLAQLEYQSGDAENALRHIEETATLSLAQGQVDEALRQIVSLAEINSETGDNVKASAAYVRAAAIEIDSRLDLENAARYFELAWSLHAQETTAREGTALAVRRNDSAGQAEWTERLLSTLTVPAARADALVSLARLHFSLPADGEAAQNAALHPEQAEAALSEALRLVPRHVAAELRLLAMLTAQDRISDVAQYYEEAAAFTSGEDRAGLLIQAAQVYQNQANRPHEAVAALLAARAAQADNTALTEQVADALIALHRQAEAADFDALLLQSNGFHRSFERHVAYLQETADWAQLGALHSRRAEQLHGEEASSEWLAAANAFRLGSAMERAQVCASQAFEASPTNSEAYSQMMAQLGDDVRAKAELMTLRAGAVPGESKVLFKARAQLLHSKSDSLLAAAAWDDYLAIEPHDFEALEIRAALAFAGGGARASQAFDRRLVAAGQQVSDASLRTSWFRLGEAAMETEAYRDAVECFENVYRLDIDEAQQTQTLWSLSRAAELANDVETQFKAHLLLAERIEEPQSGALLAGTLSLPIADEQAAKVLALMLERTPADAELYLRAVNTLTRLGRIGDVLQLHQQFARASFGALSSEALLKAAALAETELQQPAQAEALIEEAYRANPDNVTVLQSVLEWRRKRADLKGTEEVLLRLLSVQERQNGHRPPEIALELGQLALQTGKTQEAHAWLTEVRQGGTKTAGHGQALALLESMARSSGASLALGELLVEQAATFSTTARIKPLMEAAECFVLGGDLGAAESALKQLIAERPNEAAYELLAQVFAKRGQVKLQAETLMQLAPLLDDDTRALHWLRVAALMEQASEKDETLACVHRALREKKNPIPVATATQWLLRLGARSQAFEVGYATALADGHFEEAAALAEGVGDESSLIQALWASAKVKPQGAMVDRLQSLLLLSEDVSSLRRLGTTLDALGAETTSLWTQVLDAFDDEQAAQVLAKRGQVQAVFNAAQRSESKAMLVLLWPMVDALPMANQRWVLESAAARLPEFQREALQQLSQWQEEEGDAAAAGHSLMRAALLESQTAARVQLCVRAGLLLQQSGQHDAAVEAFSRVVLDEPDSLPALRGLVQLCVGVDDRQFVEHALRLESLVGLEELSPLTAQLADAHQRLGNVSEAAMYLARLEPSPAILERRAVLADAMGLDGDALQLREQYLDDTPSLETVLQAYLERQLLVPAARLGLKLFERQMLSTHMHRQLAERLAPELDGASLAVKLWLPLLERQPVDADGWTLLAEALRHGGLNDQAQWADGLGAWLTQSSVASPEPQCTQVTIEGYFEHQRPVAALQLSEADMPRLMRQVLDTTTALGLIDATVWLDADGSAHCYLLSPNSLLLGVAALERFASAELSCLVAVACCLGEQGKGLAEAGQGESLNNTLVENAFAATQSTLPLARVMQALESSAAPVEVAIDNVNMPVQKISPFFLKLAPVVLRRLR